MTENIQILTFDQAVKKRTGMYLGGTGSKGIVNLLKGLIRDCIEITEPSTYFFQITLEAKLKIHFEIEASNDLSKFEKSLFLDNNALRDFHLKVCEILSVEFNLNKKSKNKLQLTFQLDKTVFIEDVDYFELSENLLQYAYLNRNSEILLIDKREKYLNQNYFSFPQGIKYVYDKIVKEALGKPEFEIFFDGVLNGLRYQMFLGYRTDWYPTPFIESFANDVHTTCGGSLLDGILEGLIKGCKQHVKSSGLTDYVIRKKKFSNGLILIASVRGDDLQYGGSFKETLESDKVKKDAKNLIKQLTLDFITDNSEKAEKFLWRFNETKFESDMY